MGPLRSPDRCGSVPCRAATLGAAPAQHAQRRAVQQLACAAPMAVRDVPWLTNGPSLRPPARTPAARVGPPECILHKQLHAGCKDGRSNPYCPTAALPVLCFDVTIDAALSDSVRHRWGRAPTPRAPPAAPPARTTTSWRRRGGPWRRRGAARWRARWRRLRAEVTVPRRRRGGPTDHGGGWGRRVGGGGRRSGWGRGWGVRGPLEWQVGRWLGVGCCRSGHCVEGHEGRGVGPVAGLCARRCDVPSVLLWMGR